jgi:amidase
VAIDFATHISELDASVSDAMAEAVALLKQLGCSVEVVDLGFNFAEDFPAFAAGLLSTSTGALIVAAALQPALLTRYVATFVDKFLGNAGPVQAQQADDLIKKHHQVVQNTVFRSGFQALLMPTMTTPFVPADYQIDPSNDFFFTNGKPLTGQQFPATFPWNLMGRYPVVNVPIGRASNNVPIGMQIIGNTFDDLTAFQLAAAYSRVATPFFTNGNVPDFRMS